MTRETRIGLLVGLSFIVMFGLVLGELTGGGQLTPAEPEDTLREVKQDWAAPITLQATEPQQYVPVVQPEGTSSRSGSSVESRLLRPGRNTGRVSSTLQRRQPAPQPVAKRPAARQATATGQRRNFEELTLSQLQKRFAPAASNKKQNPSGRIYVVRSGDNLTKIARRTLKDDSYATVRKLYEANSDLLTSPDRLSVGMKLRIPS